MSLALHDHNHLCGININLFIMLISPYYLVRLSPYPILFAFSIGNLLLSMILQHFNYFLISILLSAINSFGWLYEIWIESIKEGGHTIKQTQLLYFAFILFLLSEVLIFASLFGSFLYNSIIPSVDIYNSYPYIGINIINAYSLPLLNTAILYFSGISCTISINLLAFRIRILSYWFITILLSLIFLSIQYYEYFNLAFSINDGIYGTNFFILTGFHGIHVIVGTILLTYSLLRIILNTVTYSNKIGILSSSLYWHFVDYVWLLLYLILYLWGT